MVIRDIGRGLGLGLGAGVGGEIARNVMRNVNIPGLGQDGAGPQAVDPDTGITDGIPCAGCGVHNEEGKKFCVSCGAGIVPVEAAPSAQDSATESTSCACGAANEADKKFCTSCGSKLEV